VQRESNRDKLHPWFAPFVAASHERFKAASISYSHSEGTCAIVEAEGTRALRFHDLRQVAPKAEIRHRRRLYELAQRKGANQDGHIAIRIHVALSPSKACRSSGRMEIAKKTWSAVLESGLWIHRSFFPCLWVSRTTLRTKLNSL